MVKINRMCKVLANEERIKLVLCLSMKKTVSELLLECKLSQSALSQHLKILRDADVVATQKVGKFVYYKTKDKRILEISKLLLSYK